MMYAEFRVSCETAMQWFAQDYAAKYPKAVEALFVDVLRLLPHFHCPATHWKHIQATNPIESTFVTVKLRMCVTVGAREPRD
jgi:transposase-like protein